MNAHNPSKLAAASVPLSGVAASDIGAAATARCTERPECCPTGEAGAPNLSTHSDPENFIELGYGTGPRCIQCRRNVSGCLCNAPDPDVMPVSDMKRVMPRIFDEPDYGWGLAERSAYGMGGSK